jgi:NAD(P)-dependent dehydrogenase (short-subunit alcohol dehydrogenase family)
MKNMFSMKDKVVVVTGGLGYLGSAIVKGLIEFGAQTVIADIAQKQPEELGISQEYAGRLHSFKCDLSSTDSIKDMMKKTVDTCKKIDVLINCGVYGAGYGPGSQIRHMSDEVWQKGLDGAVGTVFRCTREVVPYMEENDGGVIVNFGSMYGMVSPDFGIYGNNPSKNPPNYGAGKAAVIQFTKYAAAQFAELNIRVNSVTPGHFPSPAKSTDKNFISKLEGKTMLGRTGKAEEIVGAVMLLASDASSFMTGSNVVVDGGWTAW